GDEDAPADPGGVDPRGDHGGDAADDTHQDDPAEVHLEQSGGGHRAGVRGQEGVGDGESGEQRQAVQEDRLAGAFGGGVDDRGEDEDADVEEDRDAEDEAGEAHGEGGALLAEQAEQPARQDLGAAADLEDGAQHGAQADDDRDVAEDAAHAALDGGHRVGALDRAEEFGDRESGRQADGYGDAEQGDEGLQPHLDDQEEEQRNAEGGDGQQAGGAVDEQEQSTGVGWCPVRRGGGEREEERMGRGGASGEGDGAFGQGGSRHGVRGGAGRRAGRLRRGRTEAQPRTA